MISAHFLTINLIVVMISGIDTVYALQEGLSQGTWGTILEKLDLSTLGSKKFGVDIAQGSYEDITETAHYDGIWSSFSMLHVLRTDVPRHLTAIKCALKPNGKFVIGVKIGTGEKRDSIGRRYTYFTREELDKLLLDAGLIPTDHFEGSEVGLAGTIDPFIIVTAHA